MTPTLSKKLVNALKRTRPISLRAVNAAGERTEIGIQTTGRGGRWSQACAVLDELEWSRVELVDKAGKLLAVVENDGAAGPAGELEEIGTGVGAAPREQALLALMLRAQDVALSRHTEALRPLIDAMRVMLRDLTEQAVLWRREAGAQVRASAQLADQLAELAELVSRGAAGAAGAEEGGIVGMLKMLPALTSILGATGGAPAPPAPPAHAPPRRAPNGARPSARPPASSPSSAPPAPKAGD